MPALVKIDYELRLIAADNARLVLDSCSQWHYQFLAGFFVKKCSIQKVKGTGLWVLHLDRSGLIILPKMSIRHPRLWQKYAAGQVVASYCGVVLNKFGN